MYVFALLIAFSFPLMFVISILHIFMHEKYHWTKKISISLYQSLSITLIYAGLFANRDLDHHYYGITFAIICLTLAVAFYVVYLKIEKHKKDSTINNRSQKATLDF
ncbi:hypothetical protein COB64_03015 [Candidatus Wolfebacteria bacterium]|nr:MAG: hypothetical protein COB64_03015 [Candidatus Wolfebacteria bacterium]